MKDFLKSYGFEFMLCITTIFSLFTLLCYSVILEKMNIEKEITLKQIEVYGEEVKEDE